MGQFDNNADVRVPTLRDREVGMTKILDAEDEVVLAVRHAYGHERAEQFAYLKKNDLLDALVQIGWLPEEYRKPEPLDPREAKIQEIVLSLVNADRVTYATDDAAESYEELVNGNHGLTAYRNNAEALIDAGLVTVDE